MKKLKALWNFLGDDRLLLILAGALLAPGVKAAGRGDWFDVAICAALAVFYIWSAWRNLVPRS